MENIKEKLDSGYQIINVIMTESSFSRIPHIDFQGKQITNDINVDINHSISDDMITTELAVVFSVKNPSGSLANAKTRMVGVFKVLGNPELSKEIFATVNAPAIIYPFIREHICNLSLKGGLGSIFIPPLNFTKKKDANPKSVPA